VGDGWRGGDGDGIDVCMYACVVNGILLYPSRKSCRDLPSAATGYRGSDELLSLGF
jgi:hypothetical protein